MKLFFAAPLSGFPSDPTALGAQASRLHFARKAVRAAPASSRPSFPIALLAHVPGAWAAAEPMANAVNKTASMSRVIVFSFLGTKSARCTCRFNGAQPVGPHGRDRFGNICRRHRAEGAAIVVTGFRCAQTIRRVLFADDLLGAGDQCGRGGVDRGAEL